MSAPMAIAMFVIFSPRSCCLLTLQAERCLIPWRVGAVPHNIGRWHYDSSTTVAPLTRYLDACAVVRAGPSYGTRREGATAISRRGPGTRRRNDRFRTGLTATRPAPAQPAPHRRSA